MTRLAPLILITTIFLAGCRAMRQAPGNDRVAPGAMPVPSLNSSAENSKPPSRGNQGTGRAGSGIPSETKAGAAETPAPENRVPVPLGAEARAGFVPGDPEQRTEDFRFRYPEIADGLVMAGYPLNWPTAEAADLPEHCYTLAEKKDRSRLGGWIVLGEALLHDPDPDLRRGGLALIHLASQRILCPDRGYGGPTVPKDGPVARLGVKIQDEVIVPNLNHAAFYHGNPKPAVTAGPTQWGDYHEARADAVLIYMHALPYEEYRPRLDALIRSSWPGYLHDRMCEWVTRILQKNDRPKEDLRWIVARIDPEGKYANFRRVMMEWIDEAPTEQVDE